ncbi:hypothetical protein HD554DRAFT_2037084 [Boletus coccyginus]|nr:hypothetical protein HD554DRAFT_2037084 [Boletus coccyginus]
MNIDHSMFCKGNGSTCECEKFHWPDDSQETHQKLICYKCDHGIRSESKVQYQSSNQTTAQAEAIATFTFKKNKGLIPGNRVSSSHKTQASITAGSNHSCLPLSAQAPPKCRMFRNAAANHVASGTVT